MLKWVIWVGCACAGSRKTKNELWPETFPFGFFICHKHQQFHHRLDIASNNKVLVFKKQENQVTIREMSFWCFESKVHAYQYPKLQLWE